MGRWQVCDHSNYALELVKIRELKRELHFVTVPQKCLGKPNRPKQEAKQGKDLLKSVCEMVGSEWKGHWPRVNSHLPTGLCGCLWSGPWVDLPAVFKATKGSRYNANLHPYNQTKVWNLGEDGNYSILIQVPILHVLFHIILIATLWERASIILIS